MLSLPRGVSTRYARNPFGANPFGYLHHRSRIRLLLQYDVFALQYSAPTVVSTQHANLLGAKDDAFAYAREADHHMSLTQHGSKKSPSITRPQCTPKFFVHSRPTAPLTKQNQSQELASIPILFRLP